MNQLKRAAMAAHVACGFGLDCADSQLLLDELEKAEVNYRAATARADMLRTECDCLRRDLEAFRHMSEQGGNKLSEIAKDLSMFAAWMLSGRKL